jgi:hypothetical protein
MDEHGADRGRKRADKRAWNDALDMIGDDDDNNTSKFSKRLKKSLTSRNADEEIVGAPPVTQKNVGNEPRDISHCDSDENENLSLDRECSDSLTFGRENSGFLGTLARETSGNIVQLLRETSQDLDFSLAPITSPVNDGKIGADKLQTSVHDETATASLSRHGGQSNPPRQSHGTTMLFAVPNRSDIRDPSDARVASFGSTAPPATSSQGADPVIPYVHRPPTKRESRRGAHVRERPQMQRTARDGATHWAARVRDVRTEWAERASRSPGFKTTYYGQVEAAQGRIKSKQECLLRTLQMAADDGTIAPGPFAADRGGGFFGWCRFTVVAGREAEFRRSLEALFPPDFREDTLKETFRRAGLIPERWQWAEAWRGTTAFVYRPGRRRSDGGSAREGSGGESGV